MKSIVVTGAAGFIGSSFIREAIKKYQNNSQINTQNKESPLQIIVVDKLTYAGHEANLQPLLRDGKIIFYRHDILDSKALVTILNQHQPQAIVNFAAESHVDNSISGPLPFIETNIKGVFNLLEVSREYFSKLSDERKKQFRFLQVSTDEVFGQLGPTGFFSEQTPYSPNSPYSASKASGDLLVRAWHHTYGLPTITTNCSNNYGPRQFPEKLIPVMILNALNGKKLPVYGNGKNIRDWIFVDDHSRGVLLALEKGEVGSTYCFGGRSERNNLQVVESICAVLDQVRPKVQGKYIDQLSFVEDRKGHDFRYAIDDTKAERELGFQREYKNFEEGLSATIEWYLSHDEWLTEIKNRN